MATLLNVCGVPRSGTTMLHLMLGAGDNAIACGEVGGWFRIARHRRNATIKPAFAPLKDVPASRFHRAAADHFGVDYVVDSSKASDWVIDTQRWGVASGMDVYNVLIWKAPIELAYSKWKRGELGQWRREYVGYHRRLLDSGVAFVTVSYDELVADPFAKLRRLCEYVRRPYFEGMVRFWEFEQQFMGGSAGVRRQLKAGGFRFAKEQFAPSFEPLVERLTDQIRSDSRMAAIQEALKAREVSRCTIPEISHGHSFAPTRTQHVRNGVRRVLKLSRARFRWNVLEPYVFSRLRRTA